MDIENLTIYEKAQLAERLTIEVIQETQTVGFEFISEKNRRISRLLKVFGKHYVSHARSLSVTVSNADEEVIH